MSSWIYLSHFLDSKAPAYGGGETFQSVHVRSIEQGGSCNTALWTLPNHTGTHIDCPRHFSLYGNTLSDYPACFWVFRFVYILDVSSIAPGQHIDMKILQVESIPQDVELLLIKTGFEKERHSPDYWKANPVFSPDLADALRMYCAKLRVMGFDTISLSSWSNRALGREAHKAFLDHHKPILLLEDMNFSKVESGVSFLQVIVSPFLVSQADAAPCTVFAEIDQ